MQNRRIKNLPYQKYIIPKFHMFLIFRKRYLLQKKSKIGYEGYLVVSNVVLRRWVGAYFPYSYKKK